MFLLVIFVPKPVTGEKQARQHKADDKMLPHGH